MTASARRPLAGLHIRLVVSVFAVVLLAVQFARAGAVLQQHLGLAAGDALGVLAPAGDLDGDGLGDLIIGSPLEDGAGQQAGAVRVVSGADGSVLLQVIGTSGSRLGQGVVSLGDVDGDGIPDLAASAPGSGATAVGSVLIIAGADGSTLATLSDGLPGSGFGRSLAAAGDLDGDQVPDILVGAPEADTAGTDSGSTHVFSGADGSLVTSLHGSAAGDLFGSALDASPHCTDPDSDVVIGATQGAPCNGGAGYVRVFDRHTFALVRQIGGGAAGERLGSRAQQLGDIDADGVSDLVVGTDPRDALGNPSAPASVRVYSGATGALLRQWTGGSVGDGYGTQVAALGDVDADGHADIGIGAPYAALMGAASGFIEVRSGANGGLLQKVSGATAGQHFGGSLCALGDLDGDGLRDLAVAAPGDDQAGTDAGVVRVISFDRWATLAPGVAGTGGSVPRLEGDGSLAPLSEIVLRLSEARPLAPTSLVLGASAYVDPVSGLLVPVPDTVVNGLLTSVLGTLSYTYVWPAQGSNTIVYYQFVVQDPQAPLGAARSNTLSGSTP